MKFLMLSTLLLLMTSACDSPKVQPLGNGTSLIIQNGFDPNWDKRKAELRELLHQSHGMGLLFAIERATENTVLFSYAHEGDSPSKHRMIVSYIEPGTNHEVELQDLKGGSGTGGSQFKLIQETYTVSKQVKSLKLIFAVGVAGAKTAIAVIPEMGEGRKVYFLHIPES